MRLITLFTGLLLAFGLFSSNASASDQQMQAVTISDGFVHVAYSRHKPKQKDVVVVVNKLKSYWVKAPNNRGRIRITVPVRYYLSSWDVKALEIELERLGVKVKPKPAPPKPASYTSG